MKKILLILITLMIAISGYSQIKVYTVEAVDSLILNGEGMYIDPITSTDGQVLRRVNGSWVNYDFTGSGTDSLKIAKVNSDEYYLLDYRGGSVYDSIQVEFDDLTLTYDAQRYLSLANNTSGDGGTMIIYGGDGTGATARGGNIWIRAGAGSAGRGYIRLGDGAGDSIFVNGLLDLQEHRITNLIDGTDPTDAVTVGQLDNLTQTVYSIALPYNTTVQARVNGATEGTDYPTGWELSAGVNSIDLEITHGLGRRVANINVCTVSGTAEQLLRPFAGGYSGWQTTDENTLLINALATTPLPLKIYIIFE